MTASGTRACPTYGAPHCEQLTTEPAGAGQIWYWSIKATLFETLRDESECKEMTAIPILLPVFFTL